MMKLKKAGYLWKIFNWFLVTRAVIGMKLFDEYGFKYVHMIVLHIRMEYFQKYAAQTKVSWYVDNK